MKFQRHGFHNAACSMHVCMSDNYAIRHRCKLHIMSDNNRTLMAFINITPHCYDTGLQKICTKRLEAMKPIKLYASHIYIYLFVKK